MRPFGAAGRIDQDEDRTPAMNRIRNFCSKASIVAVACAALAGLVAPAAQAGFFEGAGVSVSGPG